MFGELVKPHTSTHTNTHIRTHTRTHTHARHVNTPARVHPNLIARSDRTNHHYNAVKARTQRRSSLSHPPQRRCIRHTRTHTYTHAQQRIKLPKSSSVSVVLRRCACRVCKRKRPRVRARCPTKPQPRRRSFGGHRNPHARAHTHFGQ